MTKTEMIWAEFERHKGTIAFATTLALCLVIGVLTLTPLHHAGPSMNHFDKVAHMLAFFTLVLPTAALWPRGMAWVGVGAVVYGAAIEVIQPFAGRSAEMADLLADGVGVGLGLIVGAALRRVIQARRS